jgi:hypothetical protein
VARQSRDFWLLAGSFSICGFSTNGLIGTHLIPAAMDHGLGIEPAVLEVDVALHPLRNLLRDHALVPE